MDSGRDREVLQDPCSRRGRKDTGKDGHKLLGILLPRGQHWLGKEGKPGSPRMSRGVNPEGCPELPQNSGAQRSGVNRGHLHVGLCIRATIPLVGTAVPSRGLRIPRVRARCLGNKSGAQHPGLCAGIAHFTLKPIPPWAKFKMPSGKTAVVYGRKTMPTFLAASSGEAQGYMVL